jgi:hypothetical protein
MIYSPKPREFYRTLSSNGVFTGPGEGFAYDPDGAWNLYFLTEPGLDVANPSNFKSYWKAIPEIVSLHASQDCWANPSMIHALETKTATEFIVWLKGKNFKPLKLYSLLGEPWIELITERAAQIDAGGIGKLRVEGNVVYPRFGGRNPF